MGAVKKMFTALMESGMTPAEAAEETELILGLRIVSDDLPPRAQEQAREILAEYNPAMGPLTYEPISGGETDGEDF